MFHTVHVALRTSSIHLCGMFCDFFITELIFRGISLFRYRYLGINLLYETKNAGFFPGPVGTMRVATETHPLGRIRILLYFTPR